jgi:hypothetical protein
MAVHGNHYIGERGFYPYRGPIGVLWEKTEKLNFLPKRNILPHMAIQAVLA